VSAQQASLLADGVDEAADGILASYKKVEIRAGVVMG